MTFMVREDRVSFFAYPACPAAEVFRSALTLAEPDIQDSALAEKLQR